MKFKIFGKQFFFFFLQDFVRGQTLWWILFIHTFPTIVQIIEMSVWYQVKRASGT